MLNSMLCTCGSGLPMMQCCLNREFDSIEEVNASLQELFSAQNQKSLTDFCGFSPDDIHHLLYNPFDAGHLVTFHKDLPGMCDVPIMKALFLLIEAIGEKGAKATAKGNLPRKLTQNVTLQFLGEDGYEKYIKYRPIQGEEDASIIHLTRVTAEAAGLLRLHRGRWRVSVKCQKHIAMKKPEKLFWLLFEAYVLSFNWTYGTRFPDYDFIQGSFLFSLFLVKRFGSKWRDQQFYSKKFLTAFPAAMNEMKRNYYSDPHEGYASDYAYLVFDRFMAFFGLAHVQDEVLKSIKVKKTALLDAFVTFKSH